MTSMMVKGQALGERFEPGTRVQGYDNAHGGTRDLQKGSSHTLGPS